MIVVAGWNSAGPCMAESPVSMMFHHARSGVGSSRAKAARS